jgi:hypothetical protein
MLCVDGERAVTGLGRKDEARGTGAQCDGMVFYIRTSCAREAHLVQNIIFAPAQYRSSNARFCTRQPAMAFGRPRDLGIVLQVLFHSGGLVWAVDGSKCMRHNGWGWGSCRDVCSVMISVYQHSRSLVRMLGRFGVFWGWQSFLFRSMWMDMDGYR